MAEVGVAGQYGGVLGLNHLAEGQHDSTVGDRERALGVLLDHEHGEAVL